MKKLDYLLLILWFSIFLLASFLTMIYSYYILLGFVLGAFGYMLFHLFMESIREEKVGDKIE